MQCLPLCAADLCGELAVLRQPRQHPPGRRHDGEAEAAVTGGRVWEGSGGRYWAWPHAEAGV